MISATATFRPRNDLGQFVDARISPAVRASVEASCKVIQQAAQGYCPVDTGELQASIAVTVEETGKTVVGTVGTDVYYAPYVEYGTGRAGAESEGAGAGPYDPNWAGMSAHPFLRPAVDENRDVIAELFKSNISMAVKG